MGHTLSPVRQLFERIASSTAAADAESRFQHFKKHVWLRIKESGSSGNDCHKSCQQVSGAALLLRWSVLHYRPPCCCSCLGFAGCLSQSSPCKHAVKAAHDKEAMLSPVAFSISTSFLSLQRQAKSSRLCCCTGQLVFVRSYFDFVRLRNFLKEEGASFVGLCEYTKHSDVSRGRSNFFHGRRHIMLYTERAHFYHRYRLRGIKVSYLASGFALWLLVNAVVMCWPCVIKALL